MEVVPGAGRGCMDSQCQSPEGQYHGRKDTSLLAYRNPSLQWPGQRTNTVLIM